MRKVWIYSPEEAHNKSLYILNMQSHHAHLDLNHSAGYEPRVTSEHLLKSLAERALRNIPGSKQVIDRTFNRGPINDPHRILPSKPINQIFHGGHY